MASPKNNKHDFVIFAKFFFQYAILIRHILSSLLILITVLGVTLAFLEDLDIGEGIYFAYITGLSIGYGDIVATSTLGRILCVVTGIIGMLFTGMIVAIANRALQATSSAVQADDTEST